MSKGIKKIYDHNKVVWKDTYRAMEKYPYKETIKITEVEKVISENNDNSIVKIFNAEYIEGVITALKAGFNPLILNSCNDNYPIENLKNGNISNECDLLRCSNLMTTINELLYPVKELEVLYTPLITFFKSPDNKKISAKPASVISIPPVKRPNLIYVKNDNITVENYENKTEEKRMISKIHNIFKTAVKYEHDCVILPDFGCKIEMNPVNKVIEIFNECIAQYKIKYVFFVIKDTAIFEVFHRSITRY